MESSGPYTAVFPQSKSYEKVMNWLVKTEPKFFTLRLRDRPSTICHSLQKGEITDCPIFSNMLA